MNGQYKKEKCHRTLVLLYLTCAMLFLTGCAGVGGLGNNKDVIRVKNDDYAEAIERAKIGDIFEFGAFEQDNNEDNGYEPIQWRVLDKTDEGILLISEYILKYSSYNIDYEDVVWENCSSRKSWNSDVYNERLFKEYELFTNDERKHIGGTKVKNDDNPDYAVDGGDDTIDKIFFLSLDEVNTYFPTDGERCAIPTDYARLDTYNLILEDDYKWWTRTPGEKQNCAVYVSENGVADVKGKSVTCDEIGARPALWLMKEEQVDIYGGKTMEYSELIDAEVGDMVLYGHYEQDGDESVTEPIEWVVVSKEDDNLLLMSRYILEEKIFGIDRFWESSEIREWLNKEFYNTAFSDNEKANIQRIITSDKTDDLVFLFSAEEARTFFRANEERMAYITEYLHGQEFRAGLLGRAEWWTRSEATATNGKGVVIVTGDGEVRSAGASPQAPEEYSYTDTGVRPVICVNLVGAETEALNMVVFGVDSNRDLDNESMPGGSGKKNTSGTGKCPNCGGSGMVKFYYGSSDLEAYLSGHDAYEVGECPMCDGTGK